MITVEEGQIVKMRDGTLVEVTGVADQDPDGYRWYASDGETINAELPVETIFLGRAVRLNVSPPHNVAKVYGTIVSDMSEVVEIVSS